MNLPFIKKFSNKVVPVYFLVLVLRDEKVNSVIFEETEGKVKIIGLREEYFTNSIDEISQEELLETLDKAISSAESTLPENIQTQKTIFGVKESWTEKDQIKKEYLSKLKKISEELGLTPIGFLVNSQAIAHLLAKEEGAPVSAILTEVNKKSITITLLRGGKTIETKSSQIHESVPFTIDTLLKHFDVPEILPSRIIIFNGKEDLSQEFISHTWSKSLPFLHLPQITNLPDGFDAKSVLFGAATQMGFEVLERDMPKEPKAVSAEKVSPRHLETELKSQTEKEEQALKKMGGDNFGFAKDIDVAKMPARHPEAVGKANTDGEFQENIADEVVERKEEITTPLKNRDENDFYAPEEKSVKNKNKVLNIGLSLVAGTLTFVFSALKKIKTEKFLSKMPKGKITILIPTMLILLAALIASYLLLIKATITITIDPEIKQEERNVLFSTINRTDPEENIIKGEFVSVSEDGSVSTAATGKKAVGDKAKGVITIYSTLQKEQTFNKGMTIKSSNNLTFVLDETVKIASASGASDPKTVKASVEASDIGKEYNLPSGTKFTVEDLSSSEVEAKNDESFSGGTKKEVTVVSSNDQAKLEKELPNQLEEKARESLESQLGKDKILLPSFVSNSLNKKTFDAKVGDEKNQVTLTGAVEFQGIVYDKNDLITFSKSLLEKDISLSQKVDYNNIEASVLDIKTNSDGDVEANLNIKALLLPKIEEDQIKKDLKGKSFKVAEDILYRINQISNVVISFSPKIPFLPKNLPNRETNIKILIK